MPRPGEHLGKLTRQCPFGGTEVAVLDVVERRAHLTRQAAGNLVAMKIRNRQSFELTPQPDRRGRLKRALVR